MNQPTLKELSRTSPLQSLLTDIIHFVDRKEMPEVVELITFWLNKAKDDTWNTAHQKIFTKDITAHHKSEIRKLYEDRFSVSEISIMYNIPESKVRPIINNVVRKERV
ncbi:MAG: hypothetical protein JWR85_3841 [Marmoricola sp.]|nr:hypothetical protein [Marmoricola sp.]